MIQFQSRTQASTPWLEEAALDQLKTILPSNCFSLIKQLHVH